MAKNVDFKDVAYQARFGMMGKVKLPIPEDFNNLNDDEKLALYRCLFDTWHDVSDFLTSSLNIDDLLNKYGDD